MDFDCGLYTITAPSGRLYVGSALSFKKRWRQHRHELRKGSHHCRGLQAAHDKYGLDALIFMRVKAIDPVHLIDAEQALMDSYPADALYNANRTAGSRLGMRHSETSKQKMRAALKGRKGRPMSEQNKAAIRAARAAKPRTLSAEHKAAIARAGIGRVASAETRAKRSAALKGRTFSPETIARMRAVKLGKKVSSATRDKMSAALKGRPKTTKVREAIIAAKLVRYGVALPIGVAPCGKNWRAQCSHAGRCHYLGVFDSPEAAHAAIQAFKASQ